MAKARNFSKVRARPLRAFRTPGAGVRRRQKTEILSPLAPGKFPIPDVQDEDRQARYAVWEAATNGSNIEFIVWEYLIFNRGQRPGLDFVFQAPFLGGRTEFGGFILDFYFPQRREGWNVQGERFHLLTPAQRTRNVLAKVRLAAQGVKVLELWEEDLLVRPLFVLDAAWFRGQEVVKRVQF